MSNYLILLIILAVGAIEKRVLRFGGQREPERELAGQIQIFEWSYRIMRFAEALDLQLANSHKFSRS